MAGAFGEKEMDKEDDPKMLRSLVKDAVYDVLASRVEHDKEGVSVQHEMLSFDDEQILTNPNGRNL